MESDPVRLTALNITVIRLAHDGMLVKSAEVVKFVTAVKAVPLMIGANVSVAATNVCVLLPATAGADTVIEPDVSPARTKEAIIYLSDDDPATAG